MLILAFIFLLLSLFSFWRSITQRRRTGLPEGRIIYADTSRWMRVDKPLYSSELKLTGKPDYLIEQGNYLIPVEVKSSKALHAPYDSHIYQLAAYCLLIQKIYDIRPPFGIVHYPNRTFAVDYTNEIESTTLRIIERIRALSAKKQMDRSHESVARCLGCGYRNVCDQALK